MKPQIGIIGAGKVGQTLARLWHRKGYRIASIYSRTTARARALAKIVEAETAPTSGAVAQHADLIILAVPDDAISTVAQSMQDAHWPGKSVVHLSGAHSIAPLQSLADRGAQVGSLHPAFPFADVETAMQNLGGATFAIEAASLHLRAQLSDLVSALDGQHIIIPEGQKARYHAALVIASNYTVTLYATAQTLLQSLSEDTSAIDNALSTLVQATVDNINRVGIPDALTGPLTRADMGTIQSHLQALDDHTLRQAYIQLAQLSLPILQQRGLDTHTLEKELQELL